VLSVGRVERGPDGKAKRLLGLNIDITERRRVEEEVRVADQRKTEFLAVLSHELRNSLAPIRNSIHLLDRSPPGSDVARRAVGVLGRQADHLTRLVDDLLDLTRISRGKIELKIALFDARVVVSCACEDARQEFDRRGVELRYADTAEPIWIEADAARVAQMVGNLLSNALKFTPPEGLVEVHVRRRGANCQIEVRDDGAGIAPSDLVRIFDPFVQAERGQGRGGLGIGLALVKDLAEKHGGAIRAESDGPDQGARFVLTIPLATPPERMAEAASPVAQPRRLSILVIEDSQDAAITLADLLTLGGHEVRIAHTGREGLDAAAATPPDVLICDIGLPDMSGYDVIKLIREGPAARAFAAALTGHAQPHDEETALAAGFDTHLAKPPPMERLESLLRKAGEKG
jgi:CheY-like chemotaxis protein